MIKTDLRNLSIIQYCVFHQILTNVEDIFYNIETAVNWERYSLLSHTSNSSKVSNFHGVVHKIYLGL